MWIARDSDTGLFLYTMSKPVRSYKMDRWEDTWDGSAFIIVPNELFPELIWGDEPIEVELKVKEK